MVRDQPHHLSLREETFFLGPQKHSASDAEVLGLLEEDCGDQSIATQFYIFISIFVNPKVKNA